MSATPATIAPAVRKARGRPPRRMALVISAAAVVARKIQAPGLSRTASTPRGAGGRPRRGAPCCPGEAPRAPRHAPHQVSAARSSRKIPPPSRISRAADPVGATRTRPPASASSSAASVALAPSMAAAPRRQPPRAASASRTAWTGPGDDARTIPRAKADARAERLMAPRYRRPDPALVPPEPRAYRGTKGGFHEPVGTSAGSGRDESDASGAPGHDDIRVSGLEDRAVRRELLRADRAQHGSAQGPGGGLQDPQGRRGHPVHRAAGGQPPPRHGPHD